MTKKSLKQQFKNSVKGKKEKPASKRFLAATGIIILPLIVGLLSTAITGSAMKSFGELNQPPLAPPAWLFPVAWTILYILMGVTLYLIYRMQSKTKAAKRLQKTELILFFVQLALNFFWTIFFFRFGLRYFSFGWLIIMWGIILALIIILFKKNQKAAAWCLVPYILWCTFAAYLNIMIAILN